MFCESPTFFYSSGLQILLLKLPLFCIHVEQQICNHNDRSSLSSRIRVLQIWFHVLVSKELEKTLSACSNSSNNGAESWEKAWGNVSCSILLMNRWDMQILSKVLWVDHEGVESYMEWMHWIDNQHPLSTTWLVFILPHKVPLSTPSTIYTFSCEKFSKENVVSLT